MGTLINATGFRQALDLAREGRFDEAQALLAGLQDEYLALFEENESLRRQLQDVSDVLDLASSMQFDGQKYWLRDGGRPDGPFCQVCYDREGQLIRLQEQERHWHCQVCGNSYIKPRPKLAPRPDAIHRSLLKNPIPLFVK